MATSSLYHGSGYFDLILQGLRRWPARDAIVDAQGLSLTYAELEQRVWRTAKALRIAGLKAGDGVAQLATNRVDTFVTMAAILANGMRYTPLHPMGSLDDQLFILDDARISALVVDVPYFEQRGIELAAKASASLMVFTLGEADFGPSLPRQAEQLDVEVLTGLPGYDDIAWVSYTGGTTGTPKGVVMTHGSMAAKSLISMAEWQWPDDIRYLASSPISHAAGFLLIPTFLNGGKVYLTAGFDPEQVLDLVERERVNTLFLVPTMIYVLMDHPRAARADLSSIESIIYASAPMSPARLKEALELFGPVMMQCYGQTECIHLTMMRKEEHTLDKPHRLASCGRPPAGVHMVLLNEEGFEVAPGEIGEVCIRSQAVMAGYWERPEESAETLRGDWLHTGDLAYQDDEGFYYLVDRAKDMIISGGFNVYPREIEDVLSEHPAVALAAVFGVPDDKWGEKVVAVVTLRPGETTDAATLISLVKDKKGAIMAPKRVDFVESLPHTALGKTDKKALRKHYWGDQRRMVN
ncbi:MAG: AMP-binding protein [Halioglobus sp.]